MKTQDLGNPVWSSLTSVQKQFSQTSGPVLRYPSGIAPFAAVESSKVIVPFESLLDEVHATYFVGVLPEVTGRGIETSKSSVVQMRAPSRPSPPDVSIVPAAEVLSVEASIEMMDLTNVAFPGFFRPRTAELGRYMGIRVDGQLVAMAGERMRLHGFREISAVCTRPGFTGRGMARHLVQRLMQEVEDTQVFLHVGENNARAINVYKALGFEVCGAVEVLRVSRKL